MHHLHRRHLVEQFGTVPEADAGVRTDLRNAGATMVDQQVCIDGNLITSRSPEDLPAFCQAITDQFADTPAHT